MAILAKSKKTGRHKAGCQCLKCLTRRGQKEAARRLIQAHSPAPDPAKRSHHRKKAVAFPSLVSEIPASSISPSIEAAPGERDNFERVAAEVLRDPALQAADPAGPVAAAAPVGASAPAAAAVGASGAVAGLTPAGVEQWLCVLPNAFASWLKDESLKLQPYELEVARQPAFALAEKHLPAVLKRSGSPEWSILCAVFLGYGLRVGIPLWQKIQLAKLRPQEQSSKNAPLESQNRTEVENRPANREAQPAPAPEAARVPDAVLPPIVTKPPTGGPITFPVPGRGVSMPS
jgi:hypothetical protein